jgi:hypothetical protein
LIRRFGGEPSLSCLLQLRQVSFQTRNNLQSFISDRMDKRRRGKLCHRGPRNRQTSAEVFYGAPEQPLPDRILAIPRRIVLHIEWKRQLDPHHTDYCPVMSIATDLLLFALRRAALVTLLFPAPPRPRTLDGQTNSATLLERLVLLRLPRHPRRGHPQGIRSQPLREVSQGAIPERSAYGKHTPSRRPDQSLDHKETHLSH